LINTEEIDPMEFLLAMLKYWNGNTQKQKQTKPPRNNKLKWTEN